MKFIVLFVFLVGCSHFNSFQFKFKPKPLPETKVIHLLNGNRGPECVESIITTDKEGNIVGTFNQSLDCPQSGILSCYDSNNISILEAYLKYLISR